MESQSVIACVVVPVGGSILQIGRVPHGQCESERRCYAKISVCRLTVSPTDIASPSVVSHKNKCLEKVVKIGSQILFSRTSERKILSGLSANMSDPPS